MGERTRAYETLYCLLSDFPIHFFNPIFVKGWSYQALVTLHCLRENGALYAGRA